MNKYPFIVDIPADEYHQAARNGEFLSSYLLADFRACPRLYFKKLMGYIEPTDSTAFETWRALHTLILEGRGKFDAEYLISEGPVNPKPGEVFGKRTKVYQQWAAEQPRKIVSGADFGWMEKVMLSVRNHQIANAILSNGRAEGTVRTTVQGEPCQIRMDWFNPDYCGMPVIADLKTCDNLSFFERDAYHYGYPEQLAFYREVFKTASDGVRCEVYIIAVEKREPFRCGVWNLTDILLDQANTRNLNAIEKLKDCRRENEWPTGYEDERTLDIL